MPFLWKPGFGLQQQLAGTALQRPSDLEHQGQRGHVLAAFDLAHVGALNACQMSKSLLGDTVFSSQRAHHSTKGLRGRDFESRRAGRPSSLNGALLHAQERRV
jgi:hypothetical protein